MSIEFTQYLRPNGMKRTIYIDLGEKYNELGQGIIDMGMFFEIEELSNGLISMTISDGDEDLIIEICENNSEVKETVKKMIDRFIDPV